MNGTSSDYIRELIRHGQDRVRLRETLKKGGASPPGPKADSAYFGGLRGRLGTKRGA